MIALPSLASLAFSIALDIKSMYDKRAVKVEFLHALSERCEHLGTALRTHSENLNRLDMTSVNTYENAKLIENCLKIVKDFIGNLTCPTALERVIGMTAVDQTALIELQLSKVDHCFKLLGHESALARFSFSQAEILNGFALLGEQVKRDAALRMDQMLAEIDKLRKISQDIKDKDILVNELYKTISDQAVTIGRLDKLVTEQAATIDRGNATINKQADDIASMTEHTTTLKNHIRDIGEAVLANATPAKKIVTTTLSAMCDVNLSKHTSPTTTNNAKSFLEEELKKER